MAITAAFALGLHGPSAAISSPGSLEGSTATARAKIPRLTLGVNAVRHGGKSRSLQVSFYSKQTFRYNSNAHLYRIEEYYRPRKALIRFLGHTYRLKKVGTALPEMVWGFLASSNRPGMLTCKVGTHPRATLKFRNKAGKFTRKIRVGCRK